jgi:putative redox protein
MLSTAESMSQRSGISPGSADPPAGASATAGVVHRVTPTSRRGVPLAGLLHVPQGADLAGVPAVVLCHGMESTKEGTKHQALAARLAPLGYVVLRFDFSYVGESGGRFEDLTISGEVEDLAGACDELWARGITRIGLIGSSLGGAVAVLFAAGEARVQSLVTIAAVARPLGIVERLSADALADWRRTGYRGDGPNRLNRSFLDDLHRVDVLAAARTVRAASLVTHGDHDRVVPVEDAHLLYEALPAPKELAITPGGDHRYSDPQLLATLLDRSVAWVTSSLPLVAGRGPTP